MGSLMKRIVNINRAENEINKMNIDNSLAALKNKPKTVTREHKKVKYGTLLKKIVESGIDENKEIQRAEQSAYDAINGQRQQEQQQPEGITMLGQLNREKPLSAITREMIQEYQEEQNKPFMIDGEARKYMKADYEPIIRIPVDISDIKDELRALNRNRVATGNTIKDLDDNIKALNEYYRDFLRDINIFGMNVAKRDEKLKLEKDMDNLLQQRKKLNNDLDKYDYHIKKLMEEAREIKRNNALIPEQNREEVQKYEQALMQMNRNRSNIPIRQ